MDHYNGISKGYNELYGQEQKKKMELIKSRMEFRDTDRILDVGCGTGLSSDLPGEVTGVDPSEELLGQAGIQTVKGIAEDLPFPDSSFDVVVSVTAIQNFRDIRKGLEEIRRVGKDRFVLTFLKRSIKRPKIEQEISLLFDHYEIIEEEKDMIYIVGGKGRK